jgi:hypothetical protein
MLALALSTMTNIQSSLKRLQLIARLNDEEMHDYARRAYQQKGLVLVDIKEINDPYFKQEIVNYADNKYGKRK